MIFSFPYTASSGECTRSERLQKDFRKRKDEISKQFFFFWRHNENLSLGFFHLSLTRFVPVQGQMSGQFSGAFDLVPWFSKLFWPYCSDKRILTQGRPGGSVV